MKLQIWKQFKVGKYTITINKPVRKKTNKPKESAYARNFYKKYPACSDIK